MKKWIIVIGSTLLLSGCFIGPREEKLSHSAVPMTDEAETKLIEAASSVTHSLNQLAQIEKAMHPPLHLPQPSNPGRIGMANLVSVDWTGPVEPLLRKVAKATHYRLRVLGHSPAIPVIVNVTKADQPMMDLVRDLTYQTAKRADILLYPRHHVIELRYHV